MFHLQHSAQPGAAIQRMDTQLHGQPCTLIAPSAVLTAKGVIWVHVTKKVPSWRRYFLVQTFSQLAQSGTTHQMRPLGQARGMWTWTALGLGQPADHDPNEFVVEDWLDSLASQINLSSLFILVILVFI